jgi:hypothetical protein
MPLDFMRRLRGAFGNALVWGAGWFAVALVVVVALTALGIVSGGFGWLALLGLPIRIGVLGFCAGGAFSLAIGLLCRGRRLEELSWVRFGIGGALVGAVFMPLLLQTLNIFSGTGPIAWRLILDDVPWMVVFGATASAGTLRLAQRSQSAVRSGDERRVSSGNSGAGLERPGS